MQVVRRAGRWRPGRVIVLAVVLAGSSALAAPGDDAPVDATARPDRPRIGLVLGGGGAKGAAHVGVLGILDELRIPVDCVIGTSMGALIGGTFATGVDAHELEAAIRGISWQEAIAFKGQREKIPMRRKLSGVTYSNSLEFGVRAGRMTAPSGFISTQNIEQTIQRLVSRSRGVSDFDRLPIPFRAIATDMQRGEMVVLSSGSLAQAMRASMSVPGLFAPVTIGDQVLGDGGLTRNVAVDVARQTCADVVIAVAVPNPVPTPEDLQSPLTQVSRTIDVLIGANEKQQLDTLGPDDVAIVVEMSEIGPASFDRVSETIPFGRAAALAQRASLERYSLPEPQYRAWRDSVFRAEGRGLRLAAVTVTGLERVDEQYVRGVLDLAPGDEVTEAQVGGRVNDVFALSDFESVRYALRGHGDSPALELRVKEKSWGPDIVRFDLGLYMGTDSNTAFTLAADYLRSWINELGGELHGAVRVGRTSGLDASLYQPLDRGHRWFVEPGLTAQTSIEDIFQDGDAVARYQFSHAWGYLDAGRVFGRHTEVRAGVRSGRQQAERDIAFRELEEIPAEGYGGLALSVTHDSRDREILGRKGMLARVDYFRSEDSLGAVGFYERLEGTASYSLPVGENVVYLRASGGSALDTLLPAYDTFTLGGPVSFPGLSIGELRGMSYWSAQATYLHQVAEISSLFGQSVYAGFALTAGDMGERIDFSTGKTIYSGSLILSGRTPLGPVGLIVSYASTDEWQVVFGLGRPVEERSITDPAW